MRLGTALAVSDGMAITARIVGLTLALLLAASGAAQAQHGRARGRTARSETFERTLSPSGEWFVVAPYGRVWRPSPTVVGVGFEPYATGGQWVYTNYGWSFEATWEWSWVAFHYGRWVVVPGQGWVWVPGDTWGPAWVDWRVGDGYVGWAPLPPGADVVETESNPWFFVEAHNFVALNVAVHVMPRPEVQRVYRVTQPVRIEVRRGRSRWLAGPPVSRVSDAARVQIRPSRIVPPPPGRIQRVRPAPRVFARPNVLAPPRPGGSRPPSMERGPRPAFEGRPGGRGVNRFQAPLRPQPRRVAPAPVQGARGRPGRQGAENRR